MSPRYAHLLSPGRIGGMALRNRIALAAMGTNFAALDGHCTERLLAYYEARAKGGAGLLVLECLAEMGPRAGAAAPELRRILESERRLLEVGSHESWIEEDEAFRAAAARALARIDGAPEPG